MSVTSLKQPKSLYLLFFTELWERFGFYTLQTIIILYMSKALLYGDTQAYAIYASFSGLLYLMPVVGGYLADRYLGYQRAIILGGLIFIVSYLITAIPGEHAFFLGLSVLICAHGLFKPNVSSIVGTLYEENDPRREGGFTLFYMGINIGSLFPPLIAGVVVRHYGWHMGFILAAIGMTLGIITFCCGRKMLQGRGSAPEGSPLRQGLAKRTGFNIVFYVGLLAFIGILNIAFHYPAITNDVLEGLGVLVLLIVLGFACREATPVRNRMFAALMLIIISIGFWALYNQTFTSLMLFADRNMHKTFLGIPIDTEATQFFNPFYIIALSPMLSRLWTRLGQKNASPSYPSKFALGILFISSGFLLLALGIKYFGTDGMTSSGWLAGSYFLQTIGELLLSPIALAMITELCPKHLVGMMIGVWFFSNSVAAVFSGTLATYTSIPKGTSAVDALVIYQHGFLVFGLFALGLAVVSFALIPFIKRLIASPSELSA